MMVMGGRRKDRVVDDDNQMIQYFIIEFYN